MIDLPPIQEGDLDDPKNTSITENDIFNTYRETDNAYFDRFTTCFERKMILLTLFNYKYDAW